MPPGNKPNQDDLIVELEDEEGFNPPQPEEEIEEFKQPDLEASTIPGEDDEEDAGDLDNHPGEPEDGGGRRQEAYEEPIDSESYERLTALEAENRETKANAIWHQAQANAQMAEQQHTNTKVALETIEMRLEMARAARRQAEDADDRALRDNIDADIKKIEKLQSELEAAQRSIPDPNAILHEGRTRAHQVMNTQPKGKKIGAGIEARHPLAERWASANPWMRVNAKANRDVLMFGEKIAEEGYDPSSPAFYAELTRRMQRVHPGLKVVPLQAQKRVASKGQGKGGVVAPARSASGGSGKEVRLAGNAAFRGRDGKLHIKLAASEIATMRRHNLDPQNPKHRQYWADTRMKSAKKHMSSARQ